MEPGRIEVFKDPIEDKLDELADLCEHWKRNREKNRTPSAIRSALIMSIEEIIFLSKLPDMSNSKAINLGDKPCRYVVPKETIAGVLERTKNRKSNE